MTTKDKQMELKDKIVEGLELVYERLIAFEKEKNTALVIMKGGKITKIKPG